MDLLVKVIFVMSICLKASEASKKYEVTDKVYLDIKIGDQNAKRIEIGLFGKVVPQTVENFVAFAKGWNWFGEHEMRKYGDNVKFHRVIPGFAAQGGDVMKKTGLDVIEDGFGLTCKFAYGSFFPDENFKLKHAGPGYVTMAHAAKNRNGSQFAIMYKAAPHMDNEHVVFGKVLKGFDVVKEMEQYGSKFGKTSVDIIMTDSGELDKPRGMKMLNNAEGTIVE